MLSLDYSLSVLTFIVWFYKPASFIIDQPFNQLSLSYFNFKIKRLPSLETNKKASFSQKNFIKLSLVKLGLLAVYKFNLKAFNA